MSQTKLDIDSFYYNLSKNNNKLKKTFKKQKSLLKDFEIIMEDIKILDKATSLLKGLPAYRILEEQCNYYKKQFEKYKKKYISLKESASVHLDVEDIIVIDDDNKEDIIVNISNDLCSNKVNNINIKKEKEYEYTKKQVDISKYLIHKVEKKENNEELEDEQEDYDKLDDEEEELEDEEPEDEELDDDNEDEEEPTFPTFSTQTNKLEQTNKIKLDEKEENKVQEFEEQENQEEEEEEEEVFLTNINDKNYYVVSKIYGPIYDCLNNNDIGEQVGIIVASHPKFF